MTSSDAETVSKPIIIIIICTGCVMQGAPGGGRGVACDWLPSGASRDDVRAVDQVQQGNAQRATVQSTY